ncbi:hypothetical protein GGS26DRAFT_589096 [Hypomontagnella submonticulosa]|nr:hypothetical protein GGS26DRAFT_589096 [Hypomontagnella submonticulosa]
MSKLVDKFADAFRFVNLYTNNFIEWCVDESIGDSAKDFVNESTNKSLNNDGNCVFGELADFDPDEDEDGPGHVLKCCGSERPRKKAAYLVVKAAPEFVAVHDYVPVVHPWLMGLCADILGAMAVRDSKDLPAETNLVVNYDGTEYLMIQEEESWPVAQRRIRDIRLAQLEGLNLPTYDPGCLGDFTIW